MQAEPCLPLVLILAGAAMLSLWCVARMVVGPIDCLHALEML